MSCCVIVHGANRSTFRGDVASAQAKPRVELLAARTAESDLEVRGLGGDGPRFVTRASLEALPQVEALVKADENFTEVPKDGVRVRGVDLEVLELALGVSPTTALDWISIEAVCGDGYAPTFPSDYVQQHHPILVLTIDNLSPGEWSKKTSTSDLGPYFVSYANFKPAFHVLSHEDRPQVPVQITHLQIATQDRMFAGIEPPGAKKERADSPVIQGYKIAQQNCFRCHNAAGYGGTKSGRSWGELARDARDKPEWFARWVHDPKSVDAKAEMPPNPKYDRDTLTALTRYFSTMK